MRWSTVLYGCFVSRGRGYAFDVSYEPDPAVCEGIRAVAIAEDTWMAGNTTRSVYFGQQGRVGDRIGDGVVGARDGSGRRLEFFLGYVAPAGTPLPGAAELVGLKHQVDRDLLQLAQSLERSRERQSAGPVVVLPEFHPNRGSTSTWDLAVADLSANRRQGAVMLAASGTLSWIDRAASTPLPRGEPTEARPAAIDSIDALIDAKHHRIRGKKLPEGLLLPAGVVVAVAVGLIALLVNHRSGG